MVLEGDIIYAIIPNTNHYRQEKFIKYENGFPVCTVNMRDEIIMGYDSAFTDEQDAVNYCVRMKNKHEKDEIIENVLNKFRNMTTEELSQYLKSKDIKIVNNLELSHKIIRRKAKRIQRARDILWSLEFDIIYSDNKIDENLKTILLKNIDRIKLYLVNDDYEENKYNWDNANGHKRHNI